MDLAKLFKPSNNLKYELKIVPSVAASTATNKGSTNQEQAEAKNDFTTKKKRKFTGEFEKVPAASRKKKKLRDESIPKFRKPKKAELELEKVTPDTIFVGNLANTLQKKDIKKHFKKFGKIQHIRLRSVAVSDPKNSRKLTVISQDFHSQRPTLNAYIKFDTEESALEALSMNGEVIAGYHIRVDKVTPDREHDHKRSVFIGNLPFNCEEESLRDHFEGCGPIEAVRIIRDSETGLGKGFGYILFQSKDGVEIALQLPKEFQGRMLRINRSVKKPKKKKIIIPKNKGGKFRKMMREQPGNMDANRNFESQQSWASKKKSGNAPNRNFNNKNNNNRRNFKPRQDGFKRRKNF